MKQNNNDPCVCLSGLKFKKCCKFKGLGSTFSKTYAEVEEMQLYFLRLKNDKNAFVHYYPGDKKKFTIGYGPEGAFTFKGKNQADKFAEKYDNLEAVKMIDLVLEDKFEQKFE